LASRTPEGNIEEIFSKTGDNTKPVAYPFTGGWPSSYETIDLPLRTTFNYLFNALYALAFDVNKMGAALQWDTAVAYDQYAPVVGTDGVIYIAKVATTAQDPSGGANPVVWNSLLTAQELADQSAGTEGSRNVGFIGQTVYAALQARPTSATLAADPGAGLVGTITGLDLQKMIPIAFASVLFTTAVTPAFRYQFGFSGLTEIAAGVINLDLVTPFADNIYGTHVTIQRPINPNPVIAFPRNQTTSQIQVETLTDSNSPSGWFGERHDFWITVYNSR